MLSKFSSRVMRPEDWPGLRHFKAREFSFPGRMGYEFMLWIDNVREMAGVPMIASSGYRSPERNITVGGAEDSAHTDKICNAIDIKRVPRDDDPNWNFSRYRILSAAQAMDCVRIGLYANGSMHFDRTEDVRPSPRIWVVVDNPAVRR